MGGNPAGKNRCSFYWYNGMNTFEEYQALATQVPVSLRNNRDRLELPVLGLQEEAGKIGSLLTTASASGKFDLTQEQSTELKDRLSDILWYVALLSGEAGIPMQDVAAHSIAQLHERTKSEIGSANIAPQKSKRPCDSCPNRGCHIIASVKDKPPYSILKRFVPSLSAIIQ